MIVTVLQRCHLFMCGWLLCKAVYAEGKCWAGLTLKRLWRHHFSRLNTFSHHSLEYEKWNGADHDEDQIRQQVGRMDFIFNRFWDEQKMYLFLEPSRRQTLMLCSFLIVFTVHLTWQTHMSCLQMAPAGWSAREKCFAVDYRSRGHALWCADLQAHYPGRGKMTFWCARAAQVFRVLLHSEGKKWQTGRRDF